MPVEIEPRDDCDKAKDGGRDRCRNLPSSLCGPSACSCSRINFMLKISQVYEQIASGLIALYTIFAQCGADYLIELRWHVGEMVGQRRGLVAQDRSNDVARGCTCERQRSCYHFVEQHTHTEDICSRIDFLGSCLLRRHVTRRTHYHAGLGSDARGGRLSSNRWRLRLRR